MPRPLGRQGLSVDREPGDLAAAEVQEEVAPAGDRETQPDGTAVGRAAGPQVEVEGARDAPDARGPGRGIRPREDVAAAGAQPALRQAARSTRLSLGLEVIPGIRPRLAIGRPSISLMSPVKSIGLAPEM